MAIRHYRRYRNVLRQVRAERGDVCEACGKHATHIHHIVRVGDSSIHSELVYDPANMLILCVECHALMHPLIRNVSRWGSVRRMRGAMLIHQT